MTKWKPIETAPKGIMLIARGCHVQTAYSDGCGYVASDDYHSNRVYDATHWMPLPDPPKEEVE